MAGWETASAAGSTSMSIASSATGSLSGSAAGAAAGLSYLACTSGFDFDSTFLAEDPVFIFLAGISSSDAEI